MNRFRKYLTGAAVAAAALGSLSMAETAHAAAMCGGCIPFDFNYSLGSVTNAGQLNATDPSYIQQTLVGGVPTGAFAEQGALQFTTYNHPIGSGPNLGPSVGLPGVDNSTAFLYIIYNITGTLTSTDLTFNSGGTITLYTDTNPEDLSAAGIPTASATATQLASFNVLGGNAAVSVSGANVLVSAETLSAIQVTGPTNLFTTLGGQDLFGLATLFAFGHVTSDLNFAPGSCSETLDGLSASNTGCTAASSEAQIQLTTIPEPASLSILGGAMIGFGFFSRRRRSRKAA